MNRLAPRLAAAMIGTTVLSLFILFAAVQFADYRAYWMLPDEVRAQVPLPRLSFLLNPAPPQFRIGFPLTPLQQGSVQRPVLQQALGFEQRRVLQERMLLIGIVLAAALTVLLAFLLSRSIARPIAAVVKAAGGVANGDFGARVHLTERQKRSSLQTNILAVNFNRMGEALETYERERKAMVADIAHELRTPLAAMQMRLEAIQDGLIPMQDTQIEHLLNQTSVLSRLVEDLRTLSLADAGRLTLDRRQTDLSELVEEVLQAFEPQARDRQITLIFSGSSATANVDQNRIMQVLSNLLENALRVSPVGSEVSLTIKEGLKDVCLEVKDSGPGIAEPELSHIFERFVQGKDTQGSSGLGLAIVAALVKLHGGSVDAANRPAGGASFRVHLPV